MIIAMRRIHVSVLIFLVAFGLSKYGSAEKTAATKISCNSECQSIAKEFNKSIDWSAKPCESFYKFACGNAPHEKVVAEGHQKQEDNAKQLLDRILGDASYSDNPVVHLIKLYDQVCPEGEAKKTHLNSVTSFLERASSIQSWWHLENWSVSLGFDSSFFSVKYEDLSDDKNSKMLLGPPRTRCHEIDYAQKCRDILDELVDVEELPFFLETKLWMGCNKECSLFDSIQDPSLPTPKSYGPRALGKMDNWHFLWNRARKKKDRQTQMDWKLYLENYWKKSVENPVAALLQDYKFTIYIEYPKLITTLGRAIQELTDEDMRDVILWRMLIHLLEYRNPEPQNGRLELFPSVTLGVDSAQQKDFWYRIFLQSLRKPIQNLFSDIDLQTKLSIHKLQYPLKKILPEGEPWTPRERREYARMTADYHSFEMAASDARFNYHTRNNYLTQITNRGYISDWVRIGCVIGIECNKLITKNHEEFASIPAVQKEVDDLKILLDIDVSKVDRILNRIHEFEKQHLNKMWTPDNKFDENAEMFKNYVNEERSINIPFQSAKPNLLIRGVAINSDYVDLALSLMRLQRGMLMQMPESPKYQNANVNFKNEAFIPLPSHFNNDVLASLNYGALGTAIAAQLFVKMSRFKLLPSDPDDAERRGFYTTWNAFKRNSVVHNKNGVSLVTDLNIGNNDVSQWNDEILFILSYANAHCGGFDIRDYPKKFSSVDAEPLVNAMVRSIPSFKDAFVC